MKLERLSFGPQAEKQLRRLTRRDRAQAREVLSHFAEGNLPLKLVKIRKSDSSNDLPRIYMAEIRFSHRLRAFVQILPADVVFPERYLVSQITKLERDWTWDDSASTDGETADPSATKTVRRAVGLAASVAGGSRSHLREEWMAILAGAPEERLHLSSRQRSSLALGFLLAALRMRMHDVVQPAWRPVDWVLRAPSRTNAFIASVVGAQAIYIVGDDGFAALVTEVWEPCGIAGASIFALARWLGRVRGIQVAASETERADE
ncbi:hypothetical protein [Streptomyces sp. NPDC101237]|uniref:hypothetical protein n=1 Tax=Streptomyces sp. NPDC101237 TaxID=3366139 RepID=UPI00380A98F9